MILSTVATIVDGREVLTLFVSNGQWSPQSCCRSCTSVVTSVTLCHNVYVCVCVPVCASHEIRALCVSALFVRVMGFCPEV